MKLKTVLRKSGQCFSNFAMRLAEKVTTTNIEFFPPINFIQKIDIIGDIIVH